MTEEVMRRGRPRVSGLPVTQAFEYNNMESSVRLMMLCKGLMALGWIDQKTDIQTFIDLFSGEMVYRRSIWKRSAGTVAELFRRLINDCKLVSLPARQSIWVMVNAHFWDNRRGQEFGCSKLRKSHTYQSQNQTISFLTCLLDPDYELDELQKLLKQRR